MPSVLDNAKAIIATWFPPKATLAKPADGNQPLRDLFVLLRQQASGTGSEVEPTHARELCEEYNLTPELLTANLERLEQRHKWRSQLDARPQIQKSLAETTDTLERRQAEIDAMLNAWREERASLELARRDLESKHAACTGAEGELYSTGCQTSAELALSEELTAVAREVETLRLGLRETGDGAHAAPNQWPDMEKRPAAMVYAVKRVLDDKKAGRTPEKTAELQSLLKTAKARVQEFEHNLIKAEKRRQAIDKKLKAVVAEKLLPENFKLILEAPQPSHIERQQAYARQLGWGNDSTGLSIHTGR